jgi:hypothetical protein
VSTGRRPYLKALTGETLVMHTTTDASIRGVLIAVHADVYVLEHAAYLNPNGPEVPADGETLVPVHRVAFIQHLLDRPADLPRRLAAVGGDLERSLDRHCGEREHVLVECFTDLEGGRP